MINRLLQRYFYLVLLAALPGCASLPAPAPPALLFSIDRAPAELFVAADGVVEVTLIGASLRPGTILDWRWIAPDGSVQRREWRRLVDAGDTLRLPLVVRGVVRPLGRWHVLVAVGKKTLAEGTFYLVEDRQRWLARHAGDSHQRADALSQLCAAKDFDFVARGFNFNLESAEMSTLLNCLAGDLASAPVLAGLVASDGKDEALLVLLYRVKRRLVEEILAGGAESEARLQALATMVTPWDGPLFERLQGATDPALRATAAQLLGRSRSPEAEVLLERGVKDEKPAVRLATVEALRVLGTSSAHRRLSDWLHTETDARVRERIGEVLAQFEEESQR